MLTGLVTLADGSVLDLTRWPLPEGLTDGVMSRAQLAIAFNVSENTISKYAAQGMPVESEGQNGVAYEFRLSHCYAWRMQRDDAARAAKTRGDQLAQQASLAFRNLDAGQEDEAQLSARQVREWSEAEYHRNRVAEQRGDLVRAGRVQELLEDLLGILRTSMSTLPDHMERELGLGAGEVQVVQQICDGVLVKIRERIAAEMLAGAEVTPMRQAGLDRAGRDHAGQGSLI